MLRRKKKANWLLKWFGAASFLMTLLGNNQDGWRKKKPSEKITQSDENQSDRKPVYM